MMYFMGKAMMNRYCAWASLSCLSKVYHQLKYLYGNLYVYESYAHTAIAVSLRFLEGYHDGVLKVGHGQARSGREIKPSYRLGPIEKRRNEPSF